MWYSNHDGQAYNPFIHWAIGVRGGGKTFDGKKWSINSYLRKGKKFIYLRRTQAELDETWPSFLSQLTDNGVYRNKPLVQKGNSVYYEDMEIGKGLALSTAGKYTSVDYTDYDRIFFDEFMQIRNHKLKNEVELFEGLLETIFRKRSGCKVFAASNSVSIHNVYFSHYNIRPRRGSKFTQFKDPDTGRCMHLIELWKNPDYVAEKKAHELGMLTKGTKNAAFMYDNEFMLDNYTFIRPMEGKAAYQCTLYYEGKEYGVWWQESKGIFHINKEVERYCKTRFAFTTEDHRPNVVLFQTAKQNPYIKRLKLGFDYGCVYFDGVGTQDAVLTLFDYLK